MGRITLPIVICALRVHCFSFSLLFFSFFFSFSFFFLFVHSQTEPSTTQGKTPILLLKSLFHNRYFFFNSYSLALIMTDFLFINLIFCQL